MAAATCNTQLKLWFDGCPNHGLMVAKVWAFKMGTHELWFDGGCQLVRLSKWGLTSFGFDCCQLMRLSKWGDLWASVWLLPTYVWAFKMGGTYELWFDGCQLMSFKNGDSWATTTTCSISKATTIPQKNQGAWDQPNNDNRLVKYLPTIIHIEYLFRKTKKREIKPCIKDCPQILSWQGGPI
jgi:hypothetical protein